MSYSNPTFDALQFFGVDLDAAASANNQVYMYKTGSGDFEIGIIDASECNNDSSVTGASIKDALETLDAAITNPPLNVVSTATTRTMLAGEDVQLVTAGGQTISLVAIPASGTCITVKRAGTGGGNTVVDTSDAALIDGSASFNLGNYAAVKVLSDGTDWHII